MKKLRAASATAFVALAALFPACGDTPVEPAQDGAIPDTSTPETSLPDTSSPDTGFPDTSSPDTSLPDAADAGPDADLPIPTRTGACGVIDPTAAQDKTFYDALWLGNTARRGDRLVTGVDMFGRWALWDVTSGSLLAEGPATAIDSGLVGPAAHLSGALLFTLEGNAYQARDLRTGAVLHAFPAPAVPHRAFAAVDGSYVVLATDAAIELFTPTGALIRRVLAADLLTPGALPATNGVFFGRPGELWMGFSGPLENRFEIIPKSGAARVVGPLPGGLVNFSDDGELAIWHDYSGPTPVMSVRDIDGRQRGVGLTGSVVGNYSVGTDGDTVTIESLAGPTAARVASYTKLVSGDSPTMSRSHYVQVAQGLVSLRGAQPTLIPVAASPLARPTSLSVDETTGGWAMSDDEGRVAFGNASSYTTFGKLGCGRLRGMAAAENGKLVLAFSDHIEVLDATAGVFMSRREIPTTSRIVVNELGTVIATEEPAAYDLATWARLGQWTTAQGLPVAISRDGTRVAVSTTTTVDERNPRGGALLATHPANTFALTTPSRRAIYSPDGLKLAVVRTIAGTTTPGTPITVETTLHTTTESASFAAFPTYFRTNDVLEGQNLVRPPGPMPPTEWARTSESTTWTGTGAAVPGPTVVLPGTTPQRTYPTYLRKANGYLLTGRTVTKVDGSLVPPWMAPSNVERGLGDFTGGTFFWLSTEPGGVFERVRRHTF